MEHHHQLEDTGRIREIFTAQQFEIRAKVDSGFKYLLLFQWLACVVIGFLVTPQTWIGLTSGAIENGFIGLIFGGLFALPPVYFCIAFPGQKITRYLIAVAQMCFSILLIYLSGGRIETHFHVFVSLAALAFYKDEGVLWIASTVVLIDHGMRGFLLPMSVYGEAGGGIEWRFIEHGAWVLFEDVILIAGIRGINSELIEAAKAKFLLSKSRSEAVHASKVKSNFLSNMSHEIRTPLNSIVGFSDILKETKLQGDQEEYVSTIHRCSESLLRLINDILDISKIENGVMEIERHRFDIRELHYDVQRMFAASCAAKGISLEFKIADSVPSQARADSHRLRQILTNLVANAVKFTEQGRVVVELRRSEDNPAFFLWKIEDSGPGIQSENIAKLFKGFYQEDASISRRYGGTGLGLMICKNLVELMGGTISVRSTVGQGSVFEFNLPLEEG